MNKMLHYKDIGLVPRYSLVESRSQIDTSVYFCGHTFKLPIVPANMTCSISFELAEMLSTNGYFYILHRFYDYTDILNWIKEKQDKIPVISISVGVKPKDYEFIIAIRDFKLKVDFLCIDVAHGFSKSVGDMIQFIKTHLPDTKIIAGNVFGDMLSIKYLEGRGVHAIKIGLSYGAGCTTYAKTGFCSPMFSAGLMASEIANVPLIGDGSISCHADIAKSMRAGFTLCMAGSLFAACIDSPAEFIQGKKHYYGSASQKNKGHNKHVEGKELLLDCNNMTYLEKLEEIKQDLQSAISYAGREQLSGLLNVEYFQV